MAGFFVIRIILSLNFILLLCNAESADLKPKSELVEGIVHKLFNLSLSSFGKLSIEQRKGMMGKIKQKLIISAKSLGVESEKYVNFIMKGVQSIASKNNEPRNKDNSENKILRSNQKKTTSTRVKKTDEEYIKDTANKIQMVVDKTLKKFQNGKNTVSDIEQKVESVLNLLMSNKQTEKLLKTDKVLRQKIVRMIKESAMRNGVRRNYGPRRMEFEFIENINVDKTPKALEHTHSEGAKLARTPSSKSKDIKPTTIERVNKINPDNKNVTLKSTCQDHDINNICLKIKSLSTIKCDDKDLPIAHLCDSIYDCSDHSDEHDCAIQGIHKVGNASKIISDIEYALSKKCYKANIASSIISSQNEILAKVLRNQLKYIEEHTNVTQQLASHTTMKKFNAQPKKIKKAVHKVGFVITTLTTALSKTLCPDDINETRRFNTEDEGFFANFEEESLKTTTWSPDSCSCFEEFCVGKCSKDCTQVCIQKFNIDKWQCNAVGGKKTISLDLICDGKLDCIDETDENGCHTDSEIFKFESRDYYNSVLEMISIKMKTTIFEKVRRKLIDLENSIKKVQKSTTQRKPNASEVKALRDECFFTISEIYGLTKYYGPPMDVMYDTYVFLLSLNKKLVSAMKRSHTGNEMIVAANGCLCRDNKCILMNCPETCKHACPAEPVLTRFYCGGSLELNKSISIEAICNGHDDCLEDDDEKRCSKDICRKHHFVLLRHNLDKANKKISDTLIGDAIDSWTTKVKARLRVLETSERPTPQVLRAATRDMLHDLVMAYAGFTAKRRRDNDDVISDFYKIALVVMDALKSCSK